MHRHEVEPADALTQSTMRHGGADDADAGRADGEGDLLRRDVPRRLRDDPLRAGVACRRSRMPWSPTSRRRPRRSIRTRRRGTSSTCAGSAAAIPAADELAAAFGRREMAEGWTLTVEREDVCPVVRLPGDASFDDYLSTLGKKERHEIRRKLRRAEGVGDIALDRLRRPARRPRGLHRPPPEALGRARPVPADTGRRRVARLLPADVRGARRRWAAPSRVPDRRRPADRGRHPLPDRGRLPLLQRRRRSRTRATCRRAW